MSTNDKLVPGMVLGRYELLIPIAQGGMATVWAARQKGSRGFQKTVAIKTMLPALSEDPQFEQMFLDEAALAAKIHHPNVCEILDLGEQDEILYIVMEWIDGEAVSIVHKAARKNQTQLPQRLSLRCIMQACAGLHAAHELKDENDVPLQLVHRDVSPQNILVTYDGIVKLVDFGVAKAVGRSSGETNAGQLKGKVPYMSPEQARGGTVDRRTDVFAMGIVLYKLTTGLHPFMGENDLVTMRNIISRPLLPPRVKNPSFPPEIEQVLIKCLQKDPDKRYQTMAELGTAIERALAGMGISDDDLGSYVRTLMGDRGAKRRAAIRDAVRQADERFATGVYQAVVPPATVHEGVSEIVLTKVNSGVKDGLLPDRPSTLTGTPSTVTAAPSQPEPSSTQQAVVTPHDATLGRKSRSGMFLGLGVGVAAAAVLGFVFLRPGRVPGAGTDPSAHAAQQPPASVAPVVVAPPPAPTVSAAAAVTASASASAVSVRDLPDADPVTKKASLPKSVGTAETKPDAKPDTKVDPPPKRVATDKVPIFTNPGF